MHFLKPDASFLDAGCGPGSITASIARLVPDGRALGVDNSAAVIEQARKQPALPPNTSFEVADIQHLPFADNTFDVVYTSQVLIHSPDARSAMQELRRVCKVEGFVACREGHIAATMFHPPHAGLSRWREVLEGILRSAKAEPAAATSLVRWALDVGFDAASLTYSAGAITYAGEERNWYAETTAERMMEDQAWRNKCMKLGLASAQDFELMRDGYLALAADQGGVYSMPCGQLIARK